MYFEIKIRESKRKMLLAVYGKVTTTTLTKGTTNEMAGTCKDARKNSRTPKMILEGNTLRKKRKSELRRRIASRIISKE